MSPSKPGPSKIYENKPNSNINSHLDTEDEEAPDGSGSLLRLSCKGQKDKGKSKMSVVIRKRRRMGCCGSRLKKNSKGKRMMKLTRRQGQLQGEEEAGQNGNGEGGNDGSNNSEVSDSDSDADVEVSYPELPGFDTVNLDTEDEGEINNVAPAVQDQEEVVVNPNSYLNPSDRDSDGDNQSEIEDNQDEPGDDTEVGMSHLGNLHDPEVVDDEENNDRERTVIPVPVSSTSQKPEADKPSSSDSSSTFSSEEQHSEDDDGDSRLNVNVINVAATGSQRRKSKAQKFVLASGFSIPKAAFKRVAQGILQKHKMSFRFRKEAITALQVASEDYMAGIFEDCNKCVKAREAATLQPKDINLVLELRGNKWLVPKRTGPYFRKGTRSTYRKDRE